MKVRTLRTSQFLFSELQCAPWYHVLVVFSVHGQLEVYWWGKNCVRQLRLLTSRDVPVSHKSPSTA